jgi:hypothetical protein
MFGSQMDLPPCIVSSLTRLAIGQVALPFPLESGGKTFSPPCTTPVDDSSPRFGGHSLQKAMVSRSFDFAWLICSFHFENPFPLAVSFIINVEKDHISIKKSTLNYLCCLCLWVSNGLKNIKLFHVICVVRIDNDPFSCLFFEVDHQMIFLSMELFGNGGIDANRELASQEINGLSKNFSVNIVTYRFF